MAEVSKAVTPALSPDLAAVRQEIEEENAGAYPPEISPAMQLNRGELAYASPLSEQYVAPGDSVGMFRLIADRYFSVQPENVLTIQERYDRLLARDQGQFDEPPRATIAAIVAIHDEQSYLDYTLHKVIARQEGVEQDEIWLYGNMPEDVPDEKKAQATGRFNVSVDRFRQTYPQLKLRSIVQEYKHDTTRVLGKRYDGDVLMGRLRHDKLDLIAYDAQQRGGFTMDHPIVILDADTRGMTKNTISQLTAKLTAPDARHLQVQATNSFLFDTNASTEQAENLSTARRLAIVQEIRRRQWGRTIIRDYLSGSRHLGDPDHGFAGPYFEEWGAAFALGPYLMVGGYNEYGQYNEYRDLRLRFAQANSQLSEIMSYVKPAIRRVALRPYVLRWATVRGSGRRQEEFMRAWLRNQNAAEDERYAHFTAAYIRSGLPYGGFSHSDPIRSRGRSSEPIFANLAQARSIIAAILQPDHIHSSGGADVPLPDPSALLRRFGLPLPSEE